MTTRHALIVLGVLAAAGAVVYLASKREISATVTGEIPTITYRSRESAVDSEVF